jgi:hypothetical protein
VAHPHRALTGLALLLLAPAAASADPVVVRLDWVRAPGAERCPDGAALARGVAARLGRDPFGTAGERAVEGLVARADDAFTARLSLRDRAGALLGTRSLSSASPDCAALMGAVTLAVALMVDPEAALRPRPTAPVPAPRAPTPPTPRPVTVGVDVVGTAGLLPGAAPGVALRATGPITGRLGWSVAALYFPESRTSPDDGFAFGWTGVSAALCVDLVRGARGAVMGCGGALVGGMHAVVYRPAPEVPGDRGWFGLTAGARAELAPGGPWRLSAEAALLAPVTRHRYDVIGRANAAFEQSAVAGVASLGVGLSFR